MPISQPPWPTPRDQLTPQQIADASPRNAHGLYDWQARPDYAYLGCPTCGLVTCEPHVEGRATYCIHSNRQTTWRAPLAESDWTAMVPIFVSSPVERFDATTPQEG